MESCKYSHLIWLPYSEGFLEFVLELFECPSYSIRTLYTQEAKRLNKSVIFYIIQLMLWLS